MTTRLQQMGLLMVMGFMLSASLWCSIDLHYCQGNLKTFSLNGKAKNCHELAKGMASCQHHKMAINEESCSEDTGNCCHHSTFLLEDDVLQICSPIEFAKQVFQVNAYRLGINRFFLGVGIGHFVIEYLNYKPPLLRTNIVILFRSLLL